MPRHPVDNVILAGDLGTGSFRVAAVGARGRIIAAHVVPLAVCEPHPGWAEQDPELWWRALGEGIGRVLDELPATCRPAGLCLTGPTRSQVLLDADGRVLRPAILFRDARAGEAAQSAAGHFRTDGPGDAVNAFHPVGRLAWLARHEPDVFARVATLLEAKDYLNFRLTGEVAADSVTYSRFDGLRVIDRPLPAHLQRAVDLLAVRRPAPWQPVGPVTAATPPFDRLRGLPVFAGAMDTWAAVTGSGAVEAGQAYDVSGTSEAVGLLVGKVLRVPGLVSIRWGDTVHQVGGPTQAGADCAAWAHAAFRAPGSLTAAVERAGGLEPSDDLPVFLPYLAGERTPVWRDDVRGGFHGLARSHGADVLLWSVMEGVAQAVRDILSLASGAAGEPVREVVISGGGARSAAWCQLRADVLGVPVVRPATPEAGVIGAAMTAMVGLGWAADLAAAMPAAVRRGRRFAPREAHRDLFARRAAAYAALKQAALGNS